MGMGGTTKEFSHWPENLDLPDRKHLTPSAGRITGLFGAILLIAVVTAIMWITGCAGLTSGTAQTQTPTNPTPDPPPTSSGLSISTTVLTPGQTGQPYSFTLAAKGGTPSYIWSITSGTLPAGLSLMASSGQITGTPTATGQSSFTVQVKDSASTPATATQALTITVTVAVALDQYGGRSDVSCTNATGYFQPVKISNRWWLCTPAGHGLFFQGVGAWAVVNPNNKYGTSDSCVLAQHFVDEFNSWG